MSIRHWYVFFLWATQALLWISYTLLILPLVSISVWKGMYVCVCVYILFSVFLPLFLAAVGSLTLAAKDLLIWSERIKAAEDQMLKTDFLAYISPWRYQSHTCSSLFIKAIALLILFIILLLGNSGAAKLISSSQPPFGPLDLFQFRQHPATLPSWGTGPIPPLWKANGNLSAAKKYPGI